MNGQNQFHAIMGSDDLCCFVHPSDTAPALMALEARVRAVGRRGSRLVPLEKFFVARRKPRKRKYSEKRRNYNRSASPHACTGAMSSYRKVRAPSLLGFCARWRCVGLARPRWQSDRSESRFERRGTFPVALQGCGGGAERQEDGSANSSAGGRGCHEKRQSA